MIPLTRFLVVGPLSMDLSTLSAAHLAPLLGQPLSFYAEGEEPVLTLTLVDVKEEPGATMRNAPRNAFSLVLRCPGPVPITWATLYLRHPALGSIGPLLINQIINDTYGSTDAVFQICFN